ncbi:MAG: glycosyltransferase family 4 protein [Planctomycetes bacterium]|nr:glycosyltransferase family 4 protein [Planctomycetota bacterium]
MRGLFLIQGFDVAASRYRVLAHLPFLEERGIRCEARPFPEGFGARWRVFNALDEYDFVFLQRRRFGPFWTRLIRARARKIVFDFDDSIMLRNATHADQQSAGRERKFARMARAADLIFAGNAFLRDQTLPYSRQVAVIPTPVDADRYPEKRHGPRPVITLGWIGAHGSLHSLEAMRPALEEIGRRRSDLELKIVCDHFFDLSRLRVVKTPWSAETEAAEVASFDIGLMPLGNDVWSRGKCGLKALQCLAAGVPVVLSPVGVNREIVEEGVHGLFAAGEREWVDKVVGLAADPAARERMGRAGRQRVLERYSVRAVAPLVAARIAGLIGAAAPAGPPAGPSAAR